MRQACVFLMMTLLALATAPVATAGLPQGDRVPSDATFAVGIEQAGQFWQRVEALPLTGAIYQFMQSPAMQRNLDYQAFLLEKQKLEAELGYPLTPQHLMSQIFDSLLLFGQPSAEGDIPDTVFILGVRDREQAQRLLEAVDQRAQAWADEVGANTPADPASQGIVFEKLQLDGVEARHLARPVMDRVVHHYYALTDHGIVIADQMSAFTSAIAAAPPATAGLNSNPQFTRLRDQLDWQQGDMVAWYDAAAFIDDTGIAEFFSSMPGMGAVDKVALTFNMQPDGIVGRQVTSIQESAGQPRPAGEALRGIRMVGAQPLVAFVYGLFDPEVTLEQLASFTGLDPFEGGLPGLGGVDESPNQFEQATGISLRDELAPALGNELIFALNSFAPNPMGMVPLVDLTLGASVRDPQRMQSVMDKLERALEEQMAGQAEQAAAMGEQVTTPTFQTTVLEGITIRSLQIQSPMFSISPSYTISDDFVIFGLNPQHVQAAVARLRGQQPALDTHESFAQLAGMAGGDQPFSYTLVDSQRIIQTVVMPMLPFFAGAAELDMQQATEFINQVLGRIGWLASYEVRREDLVHSFSRIQMR